MEIGILEGNGMTSDLDLQLCKLIMNSYTVKKDNGRIFSNEVRQFEERKLFDV